MSSIPPTFYTHRVAFVESLASYLETSRFSDLTIKTADGDIRAHRLIVDAHSPVLARIFDQGLAREPLSSISLEEEAAHAVKAMVTFMYEFNYDVITSNCPTAPVLLHAQVYDLAERYEIIDLKSHAASNFEAAAKANWMGVDFPRAISEVYANHPVAARDLGQVLAEVSTEHVLRLMESDEFRHTIESIPAFAEAMILSRVERDKELLHEFPECIRACSYLTSSRFSDLVVKTADEELNVHKIVVCGQSAVFSRLFEGDWKETQDSTIDLQADDPSAVKAMIRFMYTFQYNNADTTTTTTTTTSPVLLHAKVYELAERYDIAALQAYAARNFESAVQRDWNSDDFPRVVNEIFTYIPATARDLGSVLVSISRRNITVLLRNRDFKHTLETVVGFAALLVGQLVEWGDRDGCD